MLDEIQDIKEAEAKLSEEPPCYLLGMFTVEPLY